MDRLLGARTFYACVGTSGGNDSKQEAAQDLEGWTWRGLFVTYLLLTHPQNITLYLGGTFKDPHQWRLQCTR